MTPVELTQFRSNYMIQWNPVNRVTNGSKKKNGGINGVAVLPGQRNEKYTAFAFALFE